MDREVRGLWPCCEHDDLGEVFLVIFVSERLYRKRKLRSGDQAAALDVGTLVYVLFTIYLRLPASLRPAHSSIPHLIPRKHLKMFTQRTSLVCSCRSAAPRRLASMYSTVRLRSLATAAKSVSRPKKEGDISSVFVSLSGGQAPQLSQRFADLKNHLIRGDESKLSASWQRLLSQLVTQNEQVRTAGPAIVPSIHYDELAQSPTKFAKQVKDRGVAVIRGVVPEDEARSYKSEVEEYVRQNPWTKGLLKL